MVKLFPFAWPCVVLLTFGVAPAQPPDAIPRVDLSGRVYDAVSGVPVEGARILFRGLRMGTPTNRDGEFYILGLPESSWVQELQVSHPCFHTVRITISRQDAMLPFVIGLPFKGPQASEGRVVPVYCSAYGRTS
jgi:hypothetical protein